MKKNLATAIVMVLLWISVCTPIFAATTTNDFEIIPLANSGEVVEQAVQDVGSKGGSVRDTYNKQAKNLENQVGNQLASGIMTRDTLLDYVVYLVRFLSQIWLLIGWIMIIYAGYLYATTIFWWGDATKGKTAITNAIIGILVIAFSYAIIKLLTSAFIS